MAQFEVPQFLNAKDKILGPLSFFQVVFFLGVAGFLFIMFVFLKFIFWIALALPVFLITLLFSFYKVNGRPFMSFSSSMFNFMTNSQTFIWKKEVDVESINAETGNIIPSVHIKISEKDEKADKKLQPKLVTFERAGEISEMLNIET